MKRSGARCDLDRDAIDALFAGQPVMDRLEVAAWTIVGALREASPKESGRLAKSWRARTERDETGRPVVRVGTNVPYFHIVQFGSANKAPTRFVDRAMSRTGMRYAPSPKE